MRLIETIREAIDNRNAAAAACVVHHLRFNRGWNHAQILARVREECHNVTDAQWDALMDEAQVKP